ncbi:MAG: hypothetical protein C0594_01365 [Marinilabiliales bacterium]|nr:MAG: hypothetical protein C0594_01365 [Marinilabiliales bacterium]
MREKKNFRKYLFIVLGSVSLIMAYIGIVMPAIPGTPFIVLTAYFYVRSSEKMYNWILRQKIFSKMIESFKKHDTVPFKFKLMLLIPFWGSVAVSLIWFAESEFSYIVISAVGLIATILVFLVKKIKL